MRAKEGKGGGENPFSPLLGRFQHGAFASKNICAPKENACTPGHVKQSKENKTLRSVHFGVVVAKLLNCKCGRIVRNQIW